MTLDDISKAANALDEETIALIREDERRATRIRLEEKEQKRKALAIACVAAGGHVWGKRKFSDIPESATVKCLICGLKEYR